MTTTAIEPAGVVSPTAMAGPATTAASKLGGVLLDLVHRAGAYTSEAALHEAEQAIRDWTRAQTGGSPALNPEAQRAPLEDVTKRIPPGGVVVAPAAPSQAIDYDKLAAALLRQRDAAQAKAAPQVPAQAKPQDPIL